MHECRILIKRYHENIFYARAPVPDFVGTPEQHDLLRGSMSLALFDRYYRAQELYVGAICILQGGAAICESHMNTGYQFKPTTMPAHNPAAYKRWLTRNKNWQPPTVFMSTRADLDYEGPGFLYPVQVSTPNLLAAQRIALECNSDSYEDIEVPKVLDILLTNDGKAFQLRGSTKEPHLREIDRGPLTFDKERAERFWDKTTEIPGAYTTNENYYP